MKLLLPSIAIAAGLSLSAIAEDKPAPAKPETPPAPEKPATPKPEATSHDGVWKPIAAVLDGARLPVDALKAITLKISGERYEVTVEGDAKIDKGTCTIDATTNPKRMTIKGTEGPNAGKTILAIFEMKDAGSLRVCYDMSGTDFPKEFKAAKGSGLYLAGYRRAKE